MASADNRFGKYILLRRIASGGMAEIYLARQEGMAGFAREVVIKRIHRHLSNDGEFVSMFHDEARLVARLSHPNIVSVHEFGQEDGAHYLAMEYVHGRPLSAAIKESKGIDIAHALRITSELCGGLDYAHSLADESGVSLGIVHRDISPQNVLLGFDGSVKIIDFGIAKAANQSHQTKAGSLKGKYSYMSPEQARGLQVDHRSDIHAAGIVLWEMLTGRSLFYRESMFDTMEAVLSLKPRSVRQGRPDLDEGIEEIVDRALAKEPDERFQTAGEMQLAVDEYTASRGLHSSSLGMGRYVRKLFRDSSPAPGAEVPAAEEAQPAEPVVAATAEAEGPSPSAGRRLDKAITRRDGQAVPPVEPNQASEVTQPEHRQQRQSRGGDHPLNPPSSNVGPRRPVGPAVTPTGGTNLPPIPPGATPTGGTRLPPSITPTGGTRLPPSVTPTGGTNLPPSVTPTGGTNLPPSVTPTGGTRLPPPVITPTGGTKLPPSSRQSPSVAPQTTPEWEYPPEPNAAPAQERQRGSGAPLFDTGDKPAQSASVENGRIEHVSAEHLVQKGTDEKQSRALIWILVVLVVLGLSVGGAFWFSSARETPVPVGEVTEPPLVVTLEPDEVTPEPLPDASPQPEDSGLGAEVQELEDGGLAEEGDDGGIPTFSQLTAFLTVFSTPPGALVWVDGRRSGERTVVRDLPVDPGEHLVELTLSGHRRWRKSVMVPAGRTEVLRVQLHADPEHDDEPEEVEDGTPVDYGLLSLDTTPSSRVFLGRKSLGRTPLDNIEIPVGEYRVTLVIAGGRRFTKSIQIRSGRSTRHNYDLLPSSDEEGSGENDEGRESPDEGSAPTEETRPPPAEEDSGESASQPVREEDEVESNSQDPGGDRFSRTCRLIRSVRWSFCSRRGESRIGGGDCFRHDESVLTGRMY